MELFVQNYNIDTIKSLDTLHIDITTLTMQVQGQLIEPKNVFSWFVVLWTTSRFHAIIPSDDNVNSKTLRNMNGLYERIFTLSLHST